MMSVLIHPPLATDLRGPGSEAILQDLKQDATIPEPSLSTSHWRPSFHITAPHGWLNDPCGLGYDPSTGLYHVAFQWNPQGNDWGNMSWGYATSDDFVTWKLSPSPCLVPSAPYDKCGVFTGCLRTTDIFGKPGALTNIYTSVSHLPIHYTLPYKRGCETLSMAVSRDGVEWERQDCNPILPGPPSEVDITGWRDPYIGPWPAMQKILGTSPSTLFGFLSGGIKNKTPTVFVYTVNANDLREWKYIGHLADVGLNFYPSRWSGDFGVNWEVANVFSLFDERVTRDFVIMGTEGCVRSDKAAGQGRAYEKRTQRQQLWMSLSPVPEDMRDDSQPLARYSFAGVFDHGCYYAANSFFDPQTSQHVVFGWITEEDLPDHLRHAYGWSGMMSLPRVLSMATLQNVTKARHSPLESITSIEAEPNENGSYTVRTLGIQPDQRLQKLRTKPFSTEVRDLKLYQPATIPLQTSKWEVKAEFAVSQNCTRVGLAIAHSTSTDPTTKTTLTWTPQTETFTITRPTPTDPQINHLPESAPHTLFTSSHNGKETEETLRIHAIFDGSAMEVFVNERTAISTRVYLPVDRCFWVSFFAEEVVGAVDGGPAGVLVRGDVWDGVGV